MLLKGARAAAADGCAAVQLRMLRRRGGGRRAVDRRFPRARRARRRRVHDLRLGDGAPRRAGDSTWHARRRCFDLRVEAASATFTPGVFGNAALNAIACVDAGARRHPAARRPPARSVREASCRRRRRSARVGASSRPAPTRSAPGAVPHDAGAADEFHLRTTAEPSVDVNGILGGKPGLPNTTIPVAAQANFSVRLAPGQDVEDDRAGRRAADPRGGAGRCRARARAARRGAPGLVSPDEPAVQIALDAFEHVIGDEAAALALRRDAADRAGARRQGHPDDPYGHRAAGVEHPLAERASARSSTCRSAWRSRASSTRGWQN